MVWSWYITSLARGTSGGSPHGFTEQSHVNYINLIINCIINCTSGVKKKQYQLWGLASKPITTSHYQLSITIINNYMTWSDPQHLNN